MDEKQKLVEMAYDMDHCNPLPDSKKKPEVDVWPEGRLVPVRSIWYTWWIVVAVTVAIVSCTLVTIYFSSPVYDDDDDDNYVKFRTSFKGNSGNLVDQDVVSSGIDNVIEYYVTVSPNERVTIIDDFNQDIQIMKITTPSDEVCYLTALQKDSYVRPADVIFGLKTDKNHVSQVYETSSAPLDDLSVLGVKGRDLCEAVPVYWIHPVSDTETHISAANFTNSLTSSSSSVRSRSKRNIRQCHTSCCWLVCCCDVHHFTWERAEHFSCVHICHGCTSSYKSVIRKLC